MLHLLVVLHGDSAAATADQEFAPHDSDALLWVPALRSAGGCEEGVLRGVLVVLVRALVCRGAHRVARACDRDDLLRTAPHLQQSVGVQDHGGGVHGLCEGRGVIAAQDGSHQYRACGVVTVSATSRVEVEVGELYAYDRGEVGCHQCYC